MEDLFYFSKQSITLQEIVDNCTNAVALDRSVILEDQANTYYQGDDFWQWYVMIEEEDDFEDFSASLLQRVEDFQPMTAITISHCVASLPRLKKVLAILMENYGGWVTYDLPDEFVIYDQNNLNELSHSGFG